MTKTTIIIDINSYESSNNNYFRLVEIIKHARNNKKNLCVILAGYKDEDVDTYTNLLIEDYNIMVVSTDLNNTVNNCLKDRDVDNPLVVLSEIDMSLAVNKNNSSYYIYMDTFLTEKITNEIKSFI